MKCQLKCPWESRGWHRKFPDWSVPEMQISRTSVSYHASHPLATLYQVTIKTYFGVLCAGTKHAITVPAKSRRSFYMKLIVFKMMFYMFFRRDSNHVSFMLRLLPGRLFFTFLAQKNVAGIGKDLTSKSRAEMHENVVI